MKFIFSRISFLALIFSGSIVSAQSLNSHWEDNLSQALEEFKDCSQTNTSEECRDMVGKTFKIVYNLTDFYDAGESRYLSANEISENLEKNTKWTALGPAYKQDILAKGQELVNEKKAVLAVFRNEEGEGLHVAMLLPGELKPSGSWGLRVPNSASFFPTDPTKSFIDQGLSYAFSKQMLLNVTIYARKY